MFNLRVFFQCIFYNNRKSFATYLGEFFEGKNKEKQVIPRTVIKYLLQTYKANKETCHIYFKLFYHAFSTAYETDNSLVYQFFLIIIHLIGFDLSDKLISSKVNIPSDKLSLKQSQDILLVLLEVLTEIKTDMDCTVKELSFRDFLKNLLIEFLHFDNPSITSYKIFIKILSIEPILIQYLTEETLCYAMLANNEDSYNEYNNLIKSIFEIYVRLHRVEGLVSKMIEGLNNGLHGKITKINSMYKFRGTFDVNISNKRSDFQVENILTVEILESFSKSLLELASWQIVNVFKTLLHFLEQVLKNIDDIENGELLFLLIYCVTNDF